MINLLNEYDKWGENENSFIKKTILNEMEDYINRRLSKYYDKIYYNDLKQEYSIFILKTIDKLGNKDHFFTYLKMQSPTVIPRIIRRLQDTIKIPVNKADKGYCIPVISNNQVNNDDEKYDIYDEIIVKNDNCIELYLSILQYANEREKEIIKYRLQGYNCDEIGKKFNISRIRVNQILQALKNKLIKNQVI